MENPEVVTFWGQFWPLSLADITTVVANLIVIGGFLASIKPVKDWATSLRRSAQAPPNASDDVVIPNATVRFDRNVGPGPYRWEMTWSDGRGGAFGSGTGNAISNALRRHLRWRMRRAKGTRALPLSQFYVVGDVRHRLDTEKKPIQIEVTDLDYIADLWWSRWLSLHYIMSRLRGRAPTFSESD